MHFCTVCLWCCTSPVNALGACYFESTMRRRVRSPYETRSLIYRSLASTGTRSLAPHFIAFYTSAFSRATTSAQRINTRERCFFWQTFPHSPCYILPRTPMPPLYASPLAAWPSAAVRRSACCDYWRMWSAILQACQSAVVLQARSLSATSPKSVVWPNSISLSFGLALTWHS